MAELEKKSLSKAKKVIIISVVVISIAIASIIIGFYVAKPYINYNNAVKYLELGKYDDAIELFQTLNDYKDSKEKVIEAKYLKAKSLMDNGDYKTSYDLFNELAGYKDCEDLKIECIYQQAVASVNDEDFRNARSLLDSITNNNKNDYKNSKELYEKCDQLEKDEKLKIKYDEAKKLYDGKEYYKSAYLFYELKNEQYKDSEDLFNESVYNYYINYVKDIEKKVNNDEEIIFEEDDISAWVNELIEKSYKDIKSWNKKFNDLCDEYYRVEAKLIICSDDYKEEQGSEYVKGIYQLCMIAKITKAHKGGLQGRILFTADYSGPTLMINGKHVEYLADIKDGYAYAYIYTPTSGTYTVKIYSGEKLLDSRTVTIFDKE